MQHARQLGIQVAGMQFVSLITPSGEETWQVESHHSSLAVAAALWTADLDNGGDLKRAASVAVARRLVAGRTAVLEVPASCRRWHGVLPPARAAGVLPRLRL